MKFEGRDIKMVWIDLDDTIIDFETNSRRALHRLWEEEPDVHSVFATANGWIDIYEYHNHKLWAQYGAGEISRSYLRMERFIRPLTAGGVPLPRARILAERFDTLYLDYLAMERALIPGSMELLKFFKEHGVKVGCLSNGFKDVQFRKIRNCGLEPWFDIVVLSDDIGVNKPAPEIFRYAERRSGISTPEAHLMIGDNPESDIAGALGAGWGAIRFLRHPGTPEAPGCKRAVDTLNDIPAMLVWE
ncbi:MAG: HAD-IA family hydrolase [Firmicutes bacterium]|nr:HAD-IA family hydrolase [Bacillota bacterium]MCM1401225.1 HAD-IA family hydrolase [Bacteroides sp.]MCM1477226.1 HAD-IA family hydrolase [Bacteroides sp.]